MNSKEYKELRRERDRVSKLLKGPVPPRYKSDLEKQVSELREAISNAHREQYNKRPSTSE